jgi:hypothetical protein
MSLHISDVFNITFKRKPAQILVLRRDAFCWGRLILQDGTEFDIHTTKDWYDYPDEDAAEGFERAAKRGSIEPPVSEPLGWTEEGA